MRLARRVSDRSAGLTAARGTWTTLQRLRAAYVGAPERAIEAEPLAKLSH
jgi:hypothetical protein